jgi:hypothetical protein
LKQGIDGIDGIDGIGTGNIWKPWQNMAKYGKKMAKPWRMIFTAQTTGPTSIIFDPGRNLEISDLERPVRQHSACPTGEMFNTLDHLWVFNTFCLLFNTAEAHTATIKFQSQLQTAPPAESGPNLYYINIRSCSKYLCNVVEKFVGCASKSSLDSFLAFGGCT